MFSVNVELSIVPGSSKATAPPKYVALFLVNVDLLITKSSLFTYNAPPSVPTRFLLNVELYTEPAYPSK